MPHINIYIQKVYNVCAYSPRICFVAADYWFLVFTMILKSCFMKLHVGPCPKVSAEIAVATAGPIENPADCEVWTAIRFLQADQILGYLVNQASFYVELFCCTTMHVRILPDRHKSCCVSNSTGASSRILQTVRIWHRRTFSFFQK